MMDTTLLYLRQTAENLGFEQVRHDGKMEHTADRRLVFESGYTYGECWARLSLETGTHREARERIEDWRVGATVKQREAWREQFCSVAIILDTNARPISVGGYIGSYKERS